MDSDERTALVAPRRSFSDVVRDHPFVFAAALLLGAAVVGTVIFLYNTFSVDEEAPIRVRNGSLELHLLSQKQVWNEDGKGSGNYEVWNAERFRDEFEVTVAVRSEAECGPSKTITGQNIVLTYRDENGEDWKVRLESAGKKTKVKPNGFQFTPPGANQILTYGTQNQGFIREIAVGPGNPSTPWCTFTHREQLDHLIILNVPQ